MTSGPTSLEGVPLMDIHVRRYQDPNLAWESSVSPADGSWVLFQPRDPSKLAPQLWRRCEKKDEHGAIVHVYEPG